jgi:hypothetical protein
VGPAADVRNLNASFFEVVEEAGNELIELFRPSSVEATLIRYNGNGMEALSTITKYDRLRTSVT